MLSETQIERYARHILLREVGGVGQEKLLAARVRIEGLGQVGTWASVYLALAGVGCLELSDPRPIPAEGLLPLLGPEAAGHPRDASLAEVLAAHNPDVRFELAGAEPPPGDMSRLLSGEGTPSLWAGAAGSDGYVGWAEARPCTRCFPAEVPAAETAALAGSLAASRILAQLLLGEAAPGLLRIQGGQEEVWEGCPHR